MHLFYRKFHPKPGDVCYIKDKILSLISFHMWKTLFIGLLIHRTQWCLIFIGHKEVI